MTAILDLWSTQNKNSVEDNPRIKFISSMVSEKDKIKIFS